MAIVGALRLGQRERVSTYTRAWAGNSLEFDYLVQAGGGGGQRYTGGGGAGGQVQSWEASAPIGTIRGRTGSVAVTIGAGSTGNGGNSDIAGIQTATGGGCSNTNANGSNGGCGGGAQYNYPTAGTGIAGPPRQGYDGGWGGGGTGASAADKATNNGATGRTTTLRGSTETFGGGGSGSGYATGVSGTSGGAGGGGNYNTAGATNTGGGGGASLNDPPYTNSGGSGIVIMRVANSDLGVGRAMRRKVSGASSTAFYAPYTVFTFTGTGTLAWNA